MSETDLDLTDKIVVFTTLGCPYSARLVKILDSTKLPFHEVRISSYPVGFLALDLMLQCGGSFSIPSLFSNSVYLGGFIEISEMSIDALCGAIKKHCPNPHAVVKQQPKIPEAVKHLQLNTVYYNCYLSMCSDKQMTKIKGKKLNFKASEIISWMVSNYSHTSNREAAVKLATKMQEAGFFVHYNTKDSGKAFLDDGVLWQFYSDQEPDILNNKVTLPPQLKSKTGDRLERFPPDIGFSILFQLASLLDQHCTTKAINYDSIEKDPNWNILFVDILEFNLITCLISLQMADKEKILFFMQLYQILRLYLNYKHKGYPTSTSTYQAYINSTFFCIQDLKFTLHTIASLLWTGRFPVEVKKEAKKSTVNNVANVFQKGGTDEKVKERKRGRFFAEPPSDTLIHAVDYRVFFATLNVNFSSPSLLVYTEKNYDFALSWSTQLYCQYVSIPNSSTVVCPLIFNVVHKAIGGQDSVFLEWLNQFLPHAANMRLTGMDLTQTTVQFKKMPWEDRILTCLAMDLEPAMFESFKKVASMPNMLPDSLALDDRRSEEEIVDDDIATIRAKITEAEQTSSPFLFLSSSQLRSLPHVAFNASTQQLKRLVAKVNEISSIPAHFKTTFQSLTSLDLSENKLKFVPELFSDLPYLESLNLSRNQITFIPNKFCTARSLKNLWLHFNLIERLPLCFAQLRALEDVNLRSNRLTILPYNFGELGYLENLDLRGNQISRMPDLSNLLCLEDLHLAQNKLESINFGLKGLRHLITLDLSNNALKELPPEVSHLVYLNEINLSNNPLLTSLPEEICEFLSLKDGVSGLDITGLTITNIPPDHLAKGISGVREHYKWNKPLPRSRAGHGKAIEMLSPRAAQSAFKKQLSTRDKRSQLLKKKTNKAEFSGNVIKDLREKYSANDSSTFFMNDSLFLNDMAMLIQNLDSSPSSSNAPNTALASSTQAQASTTNTTNSSATMIGAPDGSSAISSPRAVPSVSISLPSARGEQPSGSSPPRVQKTKSFRLANPSFPIPKFAQSDTLHTAEHRENRDRELIFLDATTSQSFVLESPPHSSLATPHTPTSANRHYSASDPTGGSSTPSSHSQSVASASNTSSSSGGIRIQDFDFKPFYQKYFVDNPHTNFAAFVKNLGPVFISIMDIPNDEQTPEDGGRMHRAPHRERSKSALLGQLIEKKSTNKLDLTKQGRRLTASTYTPRSSGSSSEKKKTLEKSTKDAKVEVPEDDKIRFKAFIRTREKDFLDTIVMEKCKVRPKDLLRILLEDYPQFAGVPFKMLAKTNEVSDSLVEIEMKLMVKGYKFGLLYMREGQKTEEEYFMNCVEYPILDENKQVIPSPDYAENTGKEQQERPARPLPAKDRDYIEFLDWIAPTISLAGWKGYCAGLDTETMMTGAHSLFCSHRDYDIMFHVATMLPFEGGEDASQQIQRKRHLGNDIVLLIFQEDNCVKFNPADIKSFFNHLFFVVKKDHNETFNRNGKTTYKLSVAYKVGVQRGFLPALPEDGFVERTKEGRDFLLTKMINSERAAYSAPGFARPYARAKEGLMNNGLNAFCSQSSRSPNWS